MMKSPTISRLYDLSIDELFIVTCYVTGMDVCTLAITGDGRLLRKLSQAVISLQYETEQSAQVLPSIFGVFNKLRHLHLGGQLSKSRNSVEFTAFDISLLPSSLESLTLACYNDISRYDFFPNDGLSRFRHLNSLSISYCNKKETFFAHISSLHLITLHVEESVFDYTDMAQVPHSLTDLHMKCLMPFESMDPSQQRFDPHKCIVPYPPNLQKLWMFPTSRRDDDMCIIDLSQLPLSLVDLSFGAIFCARFTNNLLNHNSLLRVKSYLDSDDMFEFLDKLPIGLEMIDIYAESVVAEGVDFSKFTRLHTLIIDHLDTMLTVKKDTLPHSITKLSPDFIQLLDLKSSSPLTKTLPLDSKKAYPYSDNIWRQNYDVLKHLPIQRLQAFDQVQFADFKHIRHLFITGFKYTGENNTLAEMKSLERFSFVGEDNACLLDTISVPLKKLEIETWEKPIHCDRLDFSKIWAKSLLKLKICGELSISVPINNFMRTLPQSLISLELSIEEEVDKDETGHLIRNPITVFPPRMQKMTLAVKCFDVSSIRALPKMIKMLTLGSNNLNPQDIKELPPNLHHISLSGRGDFKMGGWRFVLNYQKSLRSYFYSNPGQMGFSCYDRNDRLQGED